MIPAPEAGPVRLETERLVLGPHGVGHFGPLAAMWGDPAVVRYVGGNPSSAQDCWMRLLRYRGLWPLLGYGYWAVTEKATGRFVGDLGFSDFHRPVEPSIRGVPRPAGSWRPGPTAAGSAPRRSRSAVSSDPLMRASSPWSLQPAFPPAVQT